MKIDLYNYTGSKNGAGVYQKIISAMPEHKIFIELFAGSMAITRRKRPAQINYGIDANAGTVAALINDLYGTIENELFIKNDEALNFLNSARFRAFPPNDVLIYADPPYLQETRRSKKPLYENEFETIEQHTALIERLRALDCRVMLSGYRSDLYDRLLRDWRTLDIPTSTRGGASIETVWMNYPEPLRLHDSRYIGKNFTDRQRIKRKAERQVKKLMNLPTFERQLIFEEIAKLEKQYYEKAEN